MIMHVSHAQLLQRWNWCKCTHMAYTIQERWYTCSSCMHTAFIIYKRDATCAKYPYSLYDIGVFGMRMGTRPQTILLWLHPRPCFLFTMKWLLNVEDLLSECSLRLENWGSTNWASTEQEQHIACWWDNSWSRHMLFHTFKISAWSTSCLACSSAACSLWILARILWKSCKHQS